MRIQETPWSMIILFFILGIYSLDKAYKEFKYGYSDQDKIVRWKPGPLGNLASGIVAILYAATAIYYKF